MHHFQDVLIRILPWGTNSRFGAGSLRLSNALAHASKPGAGLGLETALCGGLATRFGKHTGAAVLSPPFPQNRTQNMVVTNAD